jgi:hypothetical protein
MLGDAKVNYVASFGNLVDSKNVSEWIKIENPFYPPGVILISNFLYFII